jgi:acetyl-CoA C-acetyltransferase
MMNQDKSNCGRDVFVVDAARSPMLKARGKPGPFSAADLAVKTLAPMMLRQALPAGACDQFISGCMMPGVKEANIARVIALRLGLDITMPAWTVQRNCASGMQAIDSAAKDIAMGRSDLVIAGGVEAMSHTPLLFGKQMTAWFARQMAAKTAMARIKNMAAFRLRSLKPVIALMEGLTDHTIGMSMGQTAEELAYRYAISRDAMDAFSVQSHERAHAARQSGRFGYLNPIIGDDGRVYAQDDGIREDSSMDQLAKLRPFFDRKFGAVTPGNSSQVSDGAAYLLLASEAAVERYHLKPRACIRGVSWAGVDPRVMGLGPVPAITQLLKSHDLKLSDIDYWELNEAFAVQTLACLAVMRSEEHMQALGLAGALGEIDSSRLNIYGGAIALGHPVSMTGARISLQLMDILQTRKAKRGIASLCIGGGQGGALLIENMVETADE